MTPRTRRTSLSSSATSMTSGRLIAFITVIASAQLPQPASTMQGKTRYDALLLLLTCWINWRRNRLLDWFFVTTLQSKSNLSFKKVVWHLQWNFFVDSLAYFWNLALSMKICIIAAMPEMRMNCFRSALSLVIGRLLPTCCNCTYVIY